MGSAPGLIIAAPASNSGKTTVTLGLLRALRNAGVKVASFKVGPDYIDPAFHEAASARMCRNLDGWAMKPGHVERLASRTAEDADIMIGEGVMGLFDGAANGAGSTADVARHLGLPVVLVIDAKGMGASAAALLHGFTEYDPALDVAGVIFNRVGGEGHKRLLEEACSAKGVALLGFIPRSADLTLPERHLGLVQAKEHPRLEKFLEGAAKLVAESVDLDRLRRLASPALASGGLTGEWGTSWGKEEESPSATVKPFLPGQRIALARDEAFAFAYPHLIEGLRADGREILPFSPLADEAPDGEADCIYLPGGYPELHAGKLAANHGFLEGLRKAAARRAFIFGECGGYMVLGQGLKDAQGHRYPMAGLLDLETSFASRRLHLGYRRVELLGGGPLWDVARTFRGHEFHYATVEREQGEPLFEAWDARGKDKGKVGLRAGTVMGSFIHLIDIEQE